MTASSAVGTGSTFQVLLPVTEEVRGPEPEKSDSALLTGSGRTVLLLEDQLSVRRFLSEVLRRYGYRRIEAENAAEALRRFDEGRDSITCGHRNSGQS